MEKRTIISENKVLFTSIYAVAIFLSAFLVFQIQPIISKNLLPWFGGTSSVWTTSLMFYSTLLFIGYAYVYLLEKLKIQFQILIHTILTISSILFVILAMFTRGSLTIGLSWTLDSGLNPSVIVLLTLFSSVGLPYVVLCATSPLFQHWYAKTSSKEPYKLYAISNTGSLLALLSYPFVFERITSLKNQELIWSILFLLFGAISIFITSRVQKVSVLSKEKFQKVTYAKDFPIKKWLFFSSIPTFMLVATSAELSQRISPIPLLWVIPLSAYLLSYIIAFTGLKIKTATLWLLITSLAMSLSSLSGDRSALFIIFSFTFLLFMMGLTFHSLLYELRPAQDLSPKFYLFTSLGGAIGTITASVIPPLIFNDVIEFQIGLTLSISFLFIYVYRNYAKNFNRKVLRYAYVGVGIITSISIIFATLYKDNSEIVYSDRDFYGVIKVQENDEYRTIINNSVVHGVQYLDKERKYETSSYYKLENTNLGAALDYSRENSKSNIDVGIIGLGAGEIASTCKDGDTYDYFEISPKVEINARKYFSYLDFCKGSSVEIGDGRILLDRNSKSNNSKKYDLLIIDAFSGDSAPTHLLTIDAMRIYESNLKSKDGIIALHISSNHLDLKRVIAANAREDGWSFQISNVIENPEEETDQNSVWALISRDGSTFNEEPFLEIKKIKDIKKIKPWTDDYVDIISALKQF